ncbi:hypothetical protein [Methylomonas rivi]|uniref:Uncharacterized protein n=1 Tax=Methylomonas rivi TaxID=2952226 RepID=A0ABT1UA02_9GAMM|nr:hypothetical protein [Methylomonas sp. WSC-6]MCQ8130695.1 hypothetical protein [Methylomonas sp. WSC-6]
MQKKQKHFYARARAFGASNSVAGLVIQKLLDFLINSRDVGIPGFLEHTPLQQVQTFGLATKADSDANGHTKSQNSNTPQSRIDSGDLLNGDQSLICGMIELLQFGLRQFALFKKLVFTNNSYIIVF